VTEERKTDYELLYRRMTTSKKKFIAQARPLEIMRRGGLVCQGGSKGY